MSNRAKSRTVQPLDARKLEELALRYVGKYATTRAKLRAYLARKLRERGWEGEQQPRTEALAEHFAELGYVDDAAYAMSKSRALGARGYGARRVADSLRTAGIAEEDASAALDHAASEQLSAALRFAERRRIGPFGSKTIDPRQREKAIAAMVRAGHSFALARTIAQLPPGSEIDAAKIAEDARLGLR